jgi:hypothetical protein
MMKISLFQYPLFLLLPWAAVGRSGQPVHCGKSGKTGHLPAIFPEMDQAVQDTVIRVCTALSGANAK